MSKKQKYEDRAEYLRNYMREYQRKNKDTLNPYKRARRYGLTVDEMNELLEQAGDSCQICHSQFGEVTTGKCIDHCHDTGKVRGIICNKCNVAIGLLGNNVEVVKGLLGYLES